MADRELKLRVLFDAADRLNKPLRAMAGGSRAAALALKGTREELNRVNDAQGQLNSFTTLRAGMRQSATAVREAEQRVAALGREIAQTAKPSRALQRDFAQATRTAEQLAESHRHDVAQLRELRTVLQAAGANTRDLARYENDLARRAAETTRVMEDQSRTLERASNRERRIGDARTRFNRTSATATNIAGAGMAAGATAVSAAAPLVASAKVAMDLEEGMAGVAKVTGLASDQIGLMRASIVDLSTQIPMTATDLSQIAAAAGAAGVGAAKAGVSLAQRRKELVEFTGDAARMGIAFDMSAEDAGSTMAKWRQAFTMTQPQVVELGDRINALTNRFGGQAGAVSGVITRVGALGDVAGVAAPQIAAMASSLNSIGIEEDVAATGIKAILLTLNKGTSATKSQQTAMKELGLDAVKLSKAMQVDGSGTIVDVLERIRKLPKDQQAANLSELFGTESVGAIAPLLTNLDALKERLQLVGDRSKYSGSMMGEFLSRINTTKGATDLAANGLQAVNLELGQQLLPHVKAAAQYTAGLAGRMRAWAKENPGLAKGIIYVAGGAAGLFALFAAGAIVIAALMAPFAALSFASTALGIKFGASMMTIGKGLLYPIRFIPMLGKAFISLAFTIARAGLVLLANPMTWIILGIVAAVALLAYGAYKLYQNWDGVVAWFGNLWSGIKGFFSSGIANITATLLGWTPLGIFYRVLQPVLGYFGIQLPAKFSDFGRMLITGLINGITARFAALKATVSGVATSVMGWFRKPVQINSPSRVFARYGGYLMEGLGNGIDRGAGGPLDRIARVSRELTGAMALGAATPAPASGAAPNGPVVGADGGFSTMTVTIHINGADRAPGEVGREVEEALERIEARRRAAAYSSFADRPDWNV
ncbi:phage tail tape measure protein [Sphingomonas panni]|uniref:phage tail tape measure protein n=1 Tax=Sphingomonas panni TaxID=237612 RepID=UPI001F5B94D0|nr:phage tail tape measure protein [Sphingomonas panni]